MATPKTPNPRTPLRYMRYPTNMVAVRSTSSELNLTSSLFSTYPSRVVAAQIAVRWALLWSTSVLPMLPCLTLAQTIRSGARPSWLWCADQLLTTCISLLLFSILRQVYPEWIRIRTRPGVSYIQQPHLRNGRIVFGSRFRRWLRFGTNGGRIHVRYIVRVVGLLRVESRARYNSLLPSCNDAALPP